MLYSRKGCRSKSSDTAHIPKNVRGVKKFDDFVKSIKGQSAKILNQDAIMEKSY